MKLRILIWVVVIAVCVGLGLWQKENLDIIYREYSSLWKHIRYEGYSMQRHGHFIPPKVTKEDPEAAAIVEVRLTPSYPVTDKRIDIIAEKLLEYPNNEFLLFELVSQLLFIEHPYAVDPQVTLRFVERLIELKPDNANYHYIKCALLLADRRGNEIGAALEELEYANKCQEYDFPYNNYKRRVINIADKARLSRFLMRELQYYYNSNPVAFDIERQLIGQANAVFTDGDINKGMRITNALAGMQECQLRDGDPKTICALNLRLQSFSGPYSFGHWYDPYGLELQRVDLTKERARDNRLKLCALGARPKKTVEKGKNIYEEEENSLAASLAAHPAVHAGEMFVAFSWGCAILLLISLLRGFGEKTKIRLSDILLFITGCIFYSCIVKGFFSLSFLKDIYFPGCFSYIDALRPIPGLTYIEYEPMLVVVLLAGPIALLGLSLKRKAWYVKVLVSLGVGGIAMFIQLYADYDLVWGWWQEYVQTGILVSIVTWVILTFARWLLRYRIIRLFLLATFFGLATILAGGYRHVHYLPIILFVLVSAPVAVVKSDEGAVFKIILRFFSRKPDIATIRNKCIELIAPFIVVYWVIFVTLVPLVAKGIKLEFREFKSIDRKIILPGLNESYKELMSTFEAEKLEKWAIYRLLGLVMPEDLPFLLQKLEGKEFKDYYNSPGLFPWPKREAGEEEKLRLERTRLNDSDLIMVMNSCGRDVVHIITNFLDNPDKEKALVARARLGDSTTKEKLEKLLQTKLQDGLDKERGEQTKNYVSYSDMPATTAEIVGALACISEPDEAAERFLDYIQKRNILNLLGDYEFFRKEVILLPTTQARTVIKSYLDKIHSCQPLLDKESNGRFRERPDVMLFPLQDVVKFYCDKQIAEEFFKIMLATANKGSYFQFFDIPPYFEGQSAELLKEGLVCTNADIRAWCIRQLRNVGYKFSRPELEMLLKDESWKVRANAVLAGGKEFALLAESDKNALVKLIASF